MSQTTGRPFWTSQTGPMKQYPWLSSDESCKVLVLGGGATGALLAYRFAEDGNDVCLLTRRPAGYGATAFGSGILEYDNNLSLVQLGKSIGRSAAVDCLNRYNEALDRVEELCSVLKETGWVRKDILSYISDGNHGDFFHTEYLVRRHSGFPVEYLDRRETRDSYSFPVEDGIFSKGLGAEIDPYQFTQSLLKRASKEFGFRCYENTEAIGIDLSDNRVTVQTNTGRTIHADKLVFATGLSQNDYLKNLAGKKAVFTVVTEPVDCFTGYEDRALLRNDEGTGFHIRTTQDDRLMITGSDSLFSGVEHRFSKASGFRKLEELRYEKLTKHLRDMFCGIDGITPAYTYTATYGYTADLLPVIGEISDYRNVYFCMESGPENILTAEIASELLLSRYHGEESGTKLFCPERKTLSRRSIFGA